MSSLFFKTKPELFYLTFALYDAKNNQKISENFYWIPNLDAFVKQMPKSRTSLSNDVFNQSPLSTGSTQSQGFKSSVFSLDGRRKFDNVQTMLTTLPVVKQALLNQINKVNLRKKMIKFRIKKPNKFKQFFVTL